MTGWHGAERNDKPGLLEKQRDGIEICRGVISYVMHYHVSISSEANRVSAFLYVAPVTDLAFSQD